MSKIATIKTQDLCIGYTHSKNKNYIVHNNLTMELHRGEVTCLLGLNGAGKSTLLRTLCGFQPALSGNIFIQDKDLKEYSSREISQLIGVVLTDKTNAGGISVYELVALGRHPYTGFFGGLKADDDVIITNALEAVGIAHKRNSYASELSDGERQKVMIAKVLAQQCPIIILDEPTAFLDITSRVEMMLLLRRLAKEQDKTILLSTHDLDMAIQLSDALWLQQKGNPMLCGCPEDLILSGSLPAFFSRTGLSFDVTTGKFIPSSTSKPIGVDGDANTAYWVSNALIRLGYKPSVISKDYPSVLCSSNNDINLTYTNGSTLNITSIAELIKEMA